MAKSATQGDNKRVRYGLEYDLHVSDVSIELDIYRHYKDRSKISKELLPRWVHFKQAVISLFGDDPETGRKGYVWHPWADIRCQSFVEEEYQTWWGPAAVAKSTDLAVFILVWWLSDPENSTAIICTTSIDSLEKRIFAEIVKYYSMYEKGTLAGKYLQKPLPCIKYGAKAPRSGIFGKAIQKGTVKEAAGDLIGVHNPYMLLAIDEMQTARDGGSDAWENLSSGCVEPKFVGTGNPDNTRDPLGIASEPVKGWDYIRRLMPPKWDTKKGICLFFDGRTSPGIEERDKYPFLLNQEDHDRTIRNHGIDSPLYWQQRIGFIAPDGIAVTVMRESYRDKFHVCDDPEWARIMYRIAGFDSSYSENGDDSIFTTGVVGYLTNGRMAIAQTSTTKIDLRLVGDELMAENIANDIKALLAQHDISVDDLGVDSTATQGPLCDWIDRVCGGKCHRVDFASSPTDHAVSVEDERRAKDVYRNRSTQLYMNAAQFAEFDQIRGMSPEAFADMVQRRYGAASGNSRLMQVEPKPDVRKRTKRSPDNGDSFICMVDVAIVKYGLLPGTGSSLSSRNVFDKMIVEDDIDGDEDNFLRNEFNDAEE